MNVLKTRAVVLLAAIAIAGTACQGEKGSAGTNGTNGGNGTYKNALTTSGLQVAVSGVTVNSDQSVTVSFSVKDDQGNPVDLAGNYSTNVAMTPRFSLSKINVASDGTMLPYTVLTKTGTSTYTTTAPDPSTVALSPTAIAPANPAVPAMSGALAEVGTGAGTYTFTFPTGGYTDAPGTGNNAGKTVRTVSNALTLDPKSTDTYVLWIEAARRTNLTNTDDAKAFKAVNVEYDFIPSGSGTPLKRQVAATAGCTKCHNAFKPEGSVSSAFHGGTRVEAAYCDVCHNPARVSTATVSDGTTPAAFSAIFVHRIHASENLLRLTSGTSTGGYQFQNACTTQSPCVCSSAKPCYPSGTTTGQATSGWQGNTCGTGTKACTCTAAQPCLPNVFHAIADVTYPQDLRNCDACHKDAAQGAQAKTTANRAVCGSCQDYVVFDTASATGLSACVDQVTGAQQKDESGNWQQCFHSAGTGGTYADDNACKGCHVQGGSGYIGDFHVAVVPPDPNNSFAQVVGTATSGTANGVACTSTAPCTCTVAVPCIGSGNNNTNAAYLAAAGAVPANATQISYVVKSVSAFNDTSVTPNALRPQIVFKFQQSVNGAAPTDVVFNTFGSGTTELIDGFVGSPSVYFAYAVPQDGITAPADFNASQSGYIKSIWNGTATGSGAGTMTGPDGNGFYTITLGMGPGAMQTSGTAKTGWQSGVACTSAVPCTCSTTAPCQVGAMIPSNAVMLTGGAGYTYGLSSTQPLTQINLAAYPYLANKTGGLIVPAPDVWIPADPKHARRVIVDNAKCKNCHAALGAAPTFHAGQRNDGPTCSFCHNANQNNSGWSGNEKDFIHGLHAGLAGGAMLPDGAAVSGGTGIRTVPFGWHATSDTDGYWNVTFPGQHNYCEACHATPTDGTHTYDFSAAASVAAIPNMLYSTAATGTPSTASFGSAPYIAVGTAYGSGFSIDKANGIITPAAGSTLVISPITAACVACHDSSAAKGHMVANGGQFYAPRSTALAAAAAYATESCLVCHGTDGAFPIADVHR